MDRDAVVGAVGGVLVVAALVGILYTEGAKPLAGGAFRWDVTWTTAQENGAQAAGTAREGETSLTAFTVDETGLAGVVVVLVWSDTVGTGDTFRITVRAPDGTERSGEGVSDAGAPAEVHVPFEGLSPAPGLAAVLADDEAAAVARAREAAGTAGVGEWTARIQLVDAGDQDAPVPGLPPVTEDTEQAWDLRTVLTRHEPRATRG